MTPPENTFWAAVDGIRDRSPRYPREAYAFVMGALADTVRRLPPERVSDPARRHLSGQELLAGVIGLARREFGVLAPAVFREWGVTEGADVGRMVFELVDAGQLTARPEDGPRDFAGIPDLPRLLGAGLSLGDPRPRP